MGIWQDRNDLVAATVGALPILVRTGKGEHTLQAGGLPEGTQIYADLAQHLIGIARPLYANDPLGVDLDATVYAFDATTIDLCLSLYPWAPFRRAKAAIKLHTLLDLRGSIPSFIHITDGKTHEVNVLDDLVIEPGAFYLMDRGYLDFSRLFVIHQAQAFFVIRAKSNTKFKRRYSHPVDRTITQVICDQTGVLTVFYSSKDYPANLRRVVVKDHTGKRITFLTNNFALKPELIADLYRQRWQVELFFKWIKQHLRIKAFLGTSENAVKTQIWIAVIYTTNAIESINARLRFDLKTRGHFPSDDAASKLIWLALRNITARLGPCGQGLEGGDEPICDPL